MRSQLRVPMSVSWIQVRKVPSKSHPPHHNSLQNTLGRIIKITQPPSSPINMTQKQHLHRLISRTFLPFHTYSICHSTLRSACAMVATWKIPRGTEHKQRGTEQSQIRGNKPRCNDEPLVGFVAVSTSELVTCTSPLGMLFPRQEPMAWGARWISRNIKERCGRKRCFSDRVFGLCVRLRLGAVEEEKKRRMG